MHHATEPRWIMILVAIFAIGLFLRLSNSKRLGLLVLFFIGGSFLMYGARQGRIHAPPHALPAAFQMSAGPMQVAVEIAPTPPPGPDKPEKPSRAKRAPKSKSVTRSSPPAPSKPAIKDTPPAPPLATVVEAAQPEVPLEAEESEAPLTLFEGTSTKGRPIEALPEWVSGLAGAKPGSNSVSFSSDRFATIAECEQELALKARDFVAHDLRQRIPEAVHWSPPYELLKSKGFIVERCVERTVIEVGQFVEPMYRVHWKASLSSDVRAAVADTWRPTIQKRRLDDVTLGFLGAAGGFAFLNLILRSVAARMAAKKTPATT
jgi:hypothetical protein